MTPTVAITPARFRQVLGHLPTGVVVVTAIDDEGPTGLAVGTFTSVSLDPPLVGFLPAASSTSFPRIRAAGSFCANVLAAGQQARSGDRRPVPMPDTVSGFSSASAATTGVVMR